MSKSVLIVDDSALIRKQLGDTLDKAGYDIGYAKTGLEAIEFVKEFDFDAITMDINMPVMDGVTAVREIMKIKPTPILMVSSLTSGDADITFEALDAGAVDFILKPGTITLRLEESEQEILDKVEACVNMPKNRIKIKKEATSKRLDLSKNNVEAKTKTSQSLNSKANGLILVGSSTGGPGLIEDIVSSLPADYPYPVVVIQHMPDTFTAGFAKRLNTKSYLEVVESVTGAAVLAGQVIIAQGGKHLTLGKKASGVLFCKHKDKNHRFFTPSVDELFLSAVKAYDPKKTILPDGEYTSLARMLEQGIHNHLGEYCPGVILLSDGANNKSDAQLSTNYMSNPIVIQGINTI